MGMAAGQARLLSITARMNDIEFKSQSVSNTKVRLADESEQVSREYTEALNKQKLSYTDWTSGTAQKIDLNSANLKGALSGQFKLVDAQGRQVVYTEADAKDKDGNPDNTKVYIKSFTQAQLYEMIESGQFMLQSYEKQEDDSYTAFGKRIEKEQQNLNFDDEEIPMSLPF